MLNDKELVEAWKNDVYQLYENDKMFMEQLNRMSESIKVAYLYISQLNTIMDNIKYEVLDPRCEQQNILFPKFDTHAETIRKIVEEGKSMGRFGDGEFAIMDNIVRQKFQRVDEKLAQRLREVIQAKEENMMVAIADNYGTLNKYTKEAADGIRLYMTEETRRQHEKYIDVTRTYADTYVTRPYVIYTDNNTDAPRKRFDALKSIWKNKKVIIVEGALTRIGVGNDLLEEAASVRRILAPAESSFDRYDDILSAALKYADKDILFLVAIGPSAAVLVYDLTKAGYQAIDIGHIDMEYEWFLRGKGCRVEVPNKYNNEVEGGNQVQQREEPKEYLEQILERFDKNKES